MSDETNDGQNLATMDDPESNTVSKAVAIEASPKRHETRVALLQLLLVIAAGFMAAAIAGVVATVVVVSSIVVMVMVHEFGHYITAKWSGMKVEQFFVGFGPRLWSFRRGETEYGVRAIPAGGFVKVIGMNNLEVVDPSEEHRAFRSSPVWRRVMMASAGSFMHYVMAFLLSFALLAFVGTRSKISTTIGDVLELQTPSPAVAAGIQPGDKVVAVDGRPIDEWTDATGQFTQSVDRPLPVTVERDGKNVDLTVTPVDRRTVVLADGTQPVVVDPNVATGFVGISAEPEYVTVAPLTAAKESIENVWTATIEVFKALGRMFSPSGIGLYAQNVADTVPEEKQQEADENRFLSVVGLTRIAHDAADSGMYAVLTLLFSINLFIGIFNMVPLLPFDGGHVAVALYEKVRSIRRPNYHADYAKLVPVSYAVLLVLFAITASALWLDIFKPLPDVFK